MGTKKSKVKKIQSPLRVGNNVLIRTVTHYHTGHIVAVTKDEILLTDAAWVADTGRFNNALVTSTLAEVEPYLSPVGINRGSVVDYTDWRGELPRSVK